MQYLTERPKITNRVAAISAPVLISEAEPELSATMLGRARAASGFATERVDISCNLHLVQSGRAQVTIGNCSSFVEAGDVFAIFPDAYVRLDNAAAQPWHFSWLILHGSRALEALGGVGLSPDQPFMRGDFRPYLEPIFGEIEGLYRDDRQDYFYPIVAAWQVMGQLMACRDLSALQSPQASLAAAARLLIYHEQSGPLTIEELAERLSVSRATLFRHFRAAYSESPSQYKERIQIERACRLLRETPATIQEVAFFCGFTTPQYFSRVFRKCLGMPPDQWRKRQRSD